MGGPNIREFLEATYRMYHRRQFVVPDPLQHLYQYAEVRDREIAGIIASSLAMGRVACIVDVVGRVLSTMGRPSSYIEKGTRDSFERDFMGFKYRFYGTHDLVDLLVGMKGAIHQHGSLERAYGPTGMGNLQVFVAELQKWTGGSLKMVADPQKGSCCKRLNLFLRWMVRHDDIDPGGWDSVSPASLTIPLDVHMFSIGKALGFIDRATADRKAALQLTASLKEIDPTDPCRFDFSLSRQGIHPDLDKKTWLQRGFVEVA